MVVCVPAPERAAATSIGRVGGSTPVPAVCPWGTHSEEFVLISILSIAILGGCVVVRGVVSDAWRMAFEVVRDSSLGRASLWRVQVANNGRDCGVEIVLRRPAVHLLAMQNLNRSTSTVGRAHTFRTRSKKRLSFELAQPQQAQPWFAVPPLHTGWKGSVS